MAEAKSNSDISLSFSHQHHRDYDIGVATDQISQDTVDKAGHHVRVSSGR